MLVQGPRILFQLVATITKRRPSQPSIQHLDMIVSLNYKVRQHPWRGATQTMGGLKERWMEKMRYGMGREIRGELSAVLTKGARALQRETLQHVFYRPAAAQSHRRGHNGANYTDMLPLWLANCRIRDMHKGSKKVETADDPFLLLSSRRTLSSPILCPSAGVM